MTAHPMPNPISRILVVWDSSSSELSVLPAAAELATLMHAELHGLFIEDDRLLRLAQLPFAQEISSTSALSRPLSFDAIERRFRVLASQVRDALAHTAEQTRVAWSFQVTRGNVMHASLAIARETDLLVIARRSPMTHTRRVTTRELAGPLPIAVLYDGSPAANRALIAACVISQSKRQSAWVILSSSSQSYESLRQGAADVLGQTGSVRFSRQLVTSLADLLMLLHQQPCALLLLPRDSAYARSEVCSQLVDRRIAELIGVVN